MILATDIRLKRYRILYNLTVRTETHPLPFCSEQSRAGSTAEGQLQNRKVNLVPSFVPGEKDSLESDTEHSKYLKLFIACSPPPSPSNTHFLKYQAQKQGSLRRTVN